MALFVYIVYFITSKSNFNLDYINENCWYILSVVCHINSIFPRVSTWSDIFHGWRKVIYKQMFTTRGNYARLCHIDEISSTCKKRYISVLALAPVQDLETVSSYSDSITVRNSKFYFGWKSAVRQVETYEIILFYFWLFSDRHFSRLSFKISSLLYDFLSFCLR